MFVIVLQFWTFFHLIEQSKLTAIVHCVKSVQIRTRKTPYLETFRAVVLAKYLPDSSLKVEYFTCISHENLGRIIALTIANIPFQ